MVLSLHCERSKSDVNSTNNNGEICTEKIKTWDSDKTELFVNNIDVRNVEILLDSFDVNDRNIDVDFIVKETSDILLNAASTSLCTYMYRSNRKDGHTPKISKPWFDEKCKETRKHYRRAKGQYRRHRNEYFLNRCKDTERIYKKTMDDSITV